MITYLFTANINIRFSLQFFKMRRKRASSQNTMEVEANASTVSSSSANVWTFEDEQRFISILTQLKGRAGDGFNFTIAV